MCLLLCAVFKYYHFIAAFTTFAHLCLESNGESASQPIEEIVQTRCNVQTLNDLIMSYSCLLSARKSHIDFYKELFCFLVGQQHPQSQDSVEDGLKFLSYRFSLAKMVCSITIHMTSRGQSDYSSNYMWN